MLDAIIDIKFGTPEATDQQIIEAAKHACAWDFIEKLDAGLDTKIGENDMDSSLLKIIKDSKAAAEGVEAQIENVYQSKIQAGERQWISGVYGQLNAPSITENPNNDYKLKYITPYSFQHNAVVYCGTLTTTGDYSMASALSWLYETVMHGTNNWYDAGNIKSIYGTL